MYSIPHVKSMAKAVAKAIKSQPEPLKHQQILDALSQGLGVKNFDIFSAQNKRSEIDFYRINLNPEELKQYWKDVEERKGLLKFKKSDLTKHIPNINTRFNLSLKTNDIITHETYSDSYGEIEYYELPFDIFNLKFSMMTPQSDYFEGIIVCLGEGESEFVKTLPSDPEALVDDLEYVISKTLKGDPKSLFERSQPNQKIATLLWDLYIKLSKVSPAKIQELEYSVGPDEIEIKWPLYKDGKTREALTIWIGSTYQEKFYYAINGEGPDKISYSEFSGKVDLIVKNITKFNRLFLTINQETIEVIKHSKCNITELFELSPAFNLLKCGFEI